jgi:T5SS/PEP-CTERM-associated repeat protein
MKNTCKQRHNNALGFGISVLAATLAFTAHANPFNDGTTTTITSDTTFNEALFVGIQNPDNTLIIQSNATVSATELIVGQLTSSSNNLVSVVGGALLMAGNSTTNGLTTGGVVVGDNDGAAAISLRNASTLDADYLYVGFGTNDSGRIELTQDETTINVANDAFVGYAGSTNTVDIGDGSTLNVGGDLNVGFAGGSNNTVIVKSGGALFVNSTNNINVVDPDADNSIDIRGNGTLQIGGNVETGTLEADLGVNLANNAKLEVGGTLTLTDNQINDRLAVILNGTLSTNTATWSSGSVVLIGDTTSNNSLTFTNGATGTSASILQLGSSSSGQNNALIIGGAGSTFTGLSDVMIGAQGDNNNLTVNDGGLVTIVGNLYLGNNGSATGNEVTIGSNSVLNANSDVIVGDYGSANTFTIADGQVAVSNDFILGRAGANNRYLHTGGTNTVTGTFIIGQTEDATGETGFVDDDNVETTGNLAIVGEGATLNIQQSLTVGQKGGGSILTIRDGGTVNVSGDAVIGDTVKDNYIYLQRDPDTRFNVTGDLVVGKEGGSNRFAVYGGTATIDGNLYLGSSTNQHVEKNFIHLETTNAALNVANAIYIGASNSVNTLDLVAGAEVNAQDLFVGTYEGTSNNVVTVTGENSLLSLTDNLEVGSLTGTNNSVVVENDGTLNVDQTNIVISGTNNFLKITDGGTLKTGDWDYSLLTGSATNILIESGSTLHLLGMLSGTNAIEGELGVVLDGTNASWSTGTNIMYVGNETDNNSLIITNGALASTSSNLFIGYLSTDNSVTVSGGGSLLNVGSDLYIGSETNEPVFPPFSFPIIPSNTLAVLNGAMVNVGNDAFLYNGGVMLIDSESQVNIAGNYEQDVYSSLKIGVSSNAVAPNLLVTGKANLAEGTTLAIYDDGIGDNTNVVQTIVKAGELTIDDETAISVLLGNININTNLLLDFSVRVSNNTMIVVDNFIKRSISDRANLDGMLTDVANDIDDLADLGNEAALELRNILGDLTETEANQAMDNFYGEKKSSAPNHNAINLGLQKIAEQLTIRAESTRDRMAAANSVPSGVAGPHAPDQVLQGWFAGYGTWADQNASGGFDGYDSNIRGFLIGADFSIAENMLLGVAGGSGTATVDKDSGATSDTRTSFGTAYLSAGTKDAFIDLSIIYGRSSIDSTLGTVFDTTADYNARNLAFYLGGGKEYASEYLIFTPEASLLANYYSQDSYDEKSTTAVARSVESFDTWYLQSSVGCKLAFYTAVGDTVIRPELRLHWLHEFNADEGDLPYALIGGTGSYQMQLQAPEEDILKLGVGCSAKVSEYLELRADLDTRRGSSYSDYTLLGSLRYQF